MDKRFKLTKDANPNYLATICRIGELHPIEGADRLMKTVINGYDIVVSKDYKEGDIVVYFPVESSINEKYLSANNQYEMGEFERNSNAEEVKKILIESENLPDDDTEGKKQLHEKARALCGFFNKNGRVRILKLRGQYSMGFIATVDTIVKYNESLSDVDWESMVGCQFNYIGNDEFCRKYVPPVKPVRSGGGEGNSVWRKRMKKLRRFDRIIEEQFAFHYDTKMLAEHIHELSPSDTVAITLKCHGTSGIFANILCNRKLSKWEKVKRFLGFHIPETEYGNVYSSRSVIKNKYINPGAKSFYGDDIWGKVDAMLSPYLERGMTVYGEIVGYIEGTSKFIQKNHDYGCKPGTWKFMPYRITMTDPMGKKDEWEIDRVDAWTHELVDKHPEIADRIMFLTILYYGKLGDLYPDLDTSSHWHENLLARMKADKDRFGMELREPLCNNKVPREGLVVRKVGDVIPRAWKLKTAAHYAMECKENDSGEANIEDVS